MQLLRRRQHYMIIDASITKFRTSEKEMAKQHINTLNNSIVIFDWGYPSYNMFNHLSDRNSFFLMRVSSSFKLVHSISSDDCILAYEIKMKLSYDTTEILLTNIY